MGACEPIRNKRLDPRDSVKNTNLYYFLLSFSCRWGTNVQLELRKAASCDGHKGTVEVHTNTTPTNKIGNRSAKIGMIGLRMSFVLSVMI